MDVPPEHTPQFAVTDGSRSSIKRQAKEMGIGDQACPSRLTWRGSGPKPPPTPGGCPKRGSGLSSHPG